MRQYIVYTKGRGKKVHKPSRMYRISLQSESPKSWVFTKPSNVRTQQKAKNSSSPKMIEVKTKEKYKKEQLTSMSANWRTIDRNRSSTQFKVLKNQKPNTSVRDNVQNTKISKLALAQDKIIKMSNGMNNTKEKLKGDSKRTSNDPYNKTVKRNRPGFRPTRNIEGSITNKTAATSTSSDSSLTKGTVATVCQIDRNSTLEKEGEPPANSRVFRIAESSNEIIHNAITNIGHKSRRLS